MYLITSRLIKQAFRVFLFKTFSRDCVNPGHEQRCPWPLENTTKHLETPVVKQLQPMTKRARDFFFNFTWKLLGWNVIFIEHVVTFRFIKKWRSSEADQLLFYLVQYSTNKAGMWQHSRASRFQAFPKPALHNPSHLKDYCAVCSCTWLTI